METLIDQIVIRLQKYSYPILHEKIRNEVVSMIEGQMKSNMMEIERMNTIQKQMLVEQIVKRYKAAMMPENEPVGTLAAQTISENMTQSSLSSHHFAGVKKGATGFARSEELTDLTDTGLCKIITTAIEFQDGRRIPRDKVALNILANSVINVLLKHLKVKDAIIGGEYPKWYRFLLLLMGKSDTLLQPEWVRIYISKDMMYKYRISLSSIAGVLNDMIETYGIALYPPISSLDPTEQPYIDVHIAADDTKSKKYLRLGELLSVQVGGISSVQTAYPQFINLLERLEILNMGNNTFELVSAAPTYVPDFAWEYMIKSMVPDAEILPRTGGKRFTSNLPIGRLQKMILQCPVKYLDVLKSQEERNGRWYVTFDESKIDEYPYLEYADLSPHVFDSQQEMQNFLLDIMVERHFFWYMECICSTLFDLFVLPEIDSTRSFTTSPIDCNNTFGYLVMRQMLYNELRENIKVNDLWLKTMLNYMTLYSEPAAIRRQGIRHDKSAWLKYTTFEEVLKYITYAAFMGEEDEGDTVSAQVLRGQVINVGRGGRNLTKSNNFIALKKQSDEESLRSQQRKGSKDRRTATTSSKGSTTTSTTKNRSVATASSSSRTTTSVANRTATRRYVEVE